MKHIFFFITIILAIASFFVVWTHIGKVSPSLTQPISIQTNGLVKKESHNSPKIVLGFIPYWLGTKATFQPELTDWAYFSLTLESDGTFVTRQNPGYTFYEKSFSNLHGLAKDKAIRTHLTVAQFDDEKVTEFLGSVSAQRQFFISLTSVQKVTPLQGVNIDFELTTEMTPELQKQFTLFIERFDAWRDQYYPELILSTDVYPSSIERLTLWDIPTIAQHLDYIVVMTYDFHRASSSTAGPISPLLNTEEQTTEKNIVYYISQFVKTIPSEKIILGVPFYGYEWETTALNPRALTFPRSGATASLERIQTLINDPTLSLKYFWEDSTLSPYITVQRGEKQYVISFENAQSLGYKLTLVKETNLGGIAIWALGYEGNDRTMWDVISQNF